MIEEAGVRLHVGKTPAKAAALAWGGSGFYNPQMRLYRDVVVLSACCSRRDGRGSRFLDAFGGTGALGLRVASTLADAGGRHAGGMSVTINDASATCESLIRENAAENGLADAVQVVREDANVLMHRVASSNEPYLPYTHVHLDPFGCIVEYLDAAVRSVDVRRGMQSHIRGEDCSSSSMPAGRDADAEIHNVLTATSTDTGVLYDRRYVRNAKRHYGVLELKLPRDRAYREQAVRMVLASVARACGRGDKGMRVLYAFPAEHFILTAVTVNYSSKDDTADLVRMSSTGEGPFYLGPLVDRAFVHNMASRATLDRCFSKASRLLQKLLEEESHVCWFLCLSRLRLPGAAESPTKKAVVQMLRAHGFCASGTLFDGEGIKTDATCDQLLDLLRQKAAAAESAPRCASRASASAPAPREDEREPGATAQYEGASLVPA